ncbi:MAG: hypothetical protein ACPGLV_17755, partial [Bacteroidia bacterium]
MKRHFILLLAAGAMIFTTACNPIADDIRSDINNQNNSGIPDDFDFATTTTSPINIKVIGADDKPLKKVGVS